MSDFVFVYGTLLPQYVPAAMRKVVAGLRFYGEGSVRGVLYDLGEYPGAVLDKSSDMRVYGAVFQLPDTWSALPELDRYEGYDPASPGNGLFVRKCCPVVLSGGSFLDSWIYEYNGSPTGARVIASGRYSVW